MNLYHLASTLLVSVCSGALALPRGSRTDTKEQSGHYSSKPVPGLELQKSDKEQSGHYSSKPVPGLELHKSSSLSSSSSSSSSSALLQSRDTTSSMRSLAVEADALVTSFGALTKDDPGNASWAGKTHLKPPTKCHWHKARATSGRRRKVCRSSQNKSLTPKQQRHCTSHSRGKGGKRKKNKGSRRHRKQQRVSRKVKARKSVNEVEFIKPSASPLSLQQLHQQRTLKVPEEAVVAGTSAVLPDRRGPRLLAKFWTSESFGGNRDDSEPVLSERSKVSVTHPHWASKPLRAGTRAAKSPAPTESQARTQAQARAVVVDMYASSVPLAGG